jgi:DNA mismatch repair protein MutS2
MKAIPHENDRALTASELESAAWAAELGGAPEIDLHGLSTDMALAELDDFLHREIMKGERVIKIIHGRGRGKLRDVTREWLTNQKQDGLVLYFRDANDPGQVGGTTLAVLEKIK